MILDLLNMGEICRMWFLSFMLSLLRNECLMNFSIVYKSAKLTINLFWQRGRMIHYDTFLVLDLVHISYASSKNSELAPSSAIHKLLHVYVKSSLLYDFQAFGPQIPKQLRRRIFLPTTHSSKFVSVLEKAPKTNLSLLNYVCMYQCIY